MPTHRTDMRIREWPIVLTCSLGYWCHKAGWSAILPFYSLDLFKDPEVVNMYDTQCINTGNNDRSDSPHFDERHGGSESAAVDGEKVEAHDLAGSAVENTGDLAFQQTAEVAAGDQAD